MSIPVIASGGLAGMKDIEGLCAVEDEGIEGVICGRAGRDSRTGRQGHQLCGTARRR